MGVKLSCPACACGWCEHCTDRDGTGGCDCEHGEVLTWYEAGSDALFLIAIWAPVMAALVILGMTCLS